MPQAINVLLDVNDNRYDINKMGLVSMEFNRFLGSTKSAKSGILSDMTITMFDKTGSSLLSILQAGQSNIRVSYGFDENMSDPYALNILKFNSTYNNLGAMVSIGAIGTQINRKFSAETYPVGTNIRNILVNMAERNNWYIGEPGSTDFIDVNLNINKTLFKGPDQTDMQFIETQILPLANQSVTNLSLNTFQTSFWDFQLTVVNDRLTLFFRKYSNRGSERRIWTYSYGESADNSIISLTNFIDFSFLVRGLSIKIPITAVDALVQPQEQLQESIESLIKSKLETIEQYIRDNNLPEINPAQFLWNIEVVPVENTGDSTIEDIVLNEIQKAINAISTIEIEVIGNPKIMPTDLINLIVKNKEGDINIVSSSAANGSYWRVIMIQEKIGMAGFTTKMQLVRESISFV